MSLEEQILDLFNKDTKLSFNSVALKLFAHQSTHNPIYNEYLKLINCDPNQISAFENIPLLPIQFFKRYDIKTGVWNAEKIYLSSGTSQTSSRSKAHIKNASWYNNISSSIFKTSGFTFKQKKVLALLPSYLENGSSSLVDMVHNFAQQSETPGKVFYLYDHEELYNRMLALLENTEDDLYVFGVTYALLDFVKKFSFQSDRITFFFTGGMKNRGEELSYNEVENFINASFPLSQICAEYGMTELCSQAYSKSTDNYKMPATMRVVAKQLDDPLSNSHKEKTSLLGIIDLANVHSLAFILTEDLGIVNRKENTFHVIGRTQNSDLRGCNLLYTNH